MVGHGLHDWWYGCLERAGVVAKGQTRGERMHKARHTAGQRVLDHTRGNLKATQKLLGHSSISTTADIYVDWDIDQLAETLREMLESES
jgi:integrase